jgi:hypothetical protein
MVSLSSGGGNEKQDGIGKCGPLQSRKRLLPATPAITIGVPSFILPNLFPLNWSYLMWRRLLIACSLLVLMAGLVWADDVSGKVKRVDTDKNTITIVLKNGDEKTYDVAKDADIYTIGPGKKNKPGPKVGIEGGLKNVKEDSSVAISTIKKSDRETVISIKVEGMGKK